MKQREEFVNLLQRLIGEQNFREPMELEAYGTVINKLKNLPDDYYQLPIIDLDGDENELAPIKFEELMSYNFPDSEWLVENLIPAESVSVISGYPGSYKTWLLLDLAIRVAKGEKFLNQFQARKAKVLYIDEENDLRLFKERVKALCDDKSLDIEFLSQKGFKLKKSQQIVNYCLKNNIKVVLMDSLIRLHNLDENSSTEMAKLFEEFKKFKLNGISVVFAHHNRKSKKGGSNPKEDLRGSSEIAAFLDNALSVVAPRRAKQIMITQSKLRQGRELYPFIVDIQKEKDKTRLAFNRYLEDEEEKLTKSEIAQERIIVLLNKHGKLNQKQIIGELGSGRDTVGESTAKSAIKELLRTNRIVSQQGKGSELLYNLAEGESVLP